MNSRTTAERRGSPDGPVTDAGTAPVGRTERRSKSRGAQEIASRLHEPMGGARWLPLAVAVPLNEPIETHGALVAALRQIEGLRDKGKVHPAFHFRSRAFLHFHDGDFGRYADVRFADDFAPVPVATPQQRAELLERVRLHVESRGRK